MKKAKRVFSFLFAFLTILSLSANSIVLCASAEGGDAGTVTANTDWFDAEATELHIKTASDLQGLLSLCNSQANGTKNSKGKTFYLDNDIDLGGMKWSGIVDFYGIFDGQGHQISNFTQDNTATTTGRDKNGGFFRNISGGGVKNLRLVQAENQFVALTLNKSTNASVGGLVGNISVGGVTLENVYVKLNVKFSLGEGGKDGNRVGGVVGMCSAGSASAKVTMTNVIFDGTVTVDTADILRIGMIVGGCSNSSNKPGGTVCLNNCFNLADHTALDRYQDTENGKYFGVHCGVIVGETQKQNSNFTNCLDRTEMPDQLDESYLVQHPELLTGWTTSETCGILPMGVARMLEKPDVYVQRSVQVAGETTYSVRILGLTDVLDYNSLSFRVDLYINGSAEAKQVEGIEPQTKVYTSVMETVGEQTNVVAASALGGKYICGVTLTGIPAADSVVRIVIRQVKTLDGVEYVGEAEYEVTYENGVLVAA